MSGIEFKNVTYRYANTDHDAVKDISFTVKPGEVKVVTGASGCGKTTLMRLANGLCPQIYGGELTGEVTADGIDVSTTPVAELSELIGTLFQDPEEQFFALSVGDEIAFALRSRGMETPEIERRVATAVKKLGIENLLDQSIHALSEGQKQKVGLAGILAMQPKILIFDEPSANLDPEATENLAVTIGELKKEGAAILVVDHRLYWLKDVADGVIVMRQGEIHEAGPFDLLKDDDLRAKYGLRLAELDDPRKTLPHVAVCHDGDGWTPASVFSASRMSFAYSEKKPIFNNVSFAVETGITALIGMNGTGKTTLARILTGLEKSNGLFSIKKDRVGKEGLMPHSGLVLQNADHQLQMRTVREEVSSAMEAGIYAEKARESFFGRFARVTLSPAEIREVNAILESLNLTALAERHPQSLSGGEKQRVVIACALAKNPSILILDEPTSGLDGANMASIAGVLKREAEKGRAVFLITHDLELLSLCDRALDMQMLQPAGLKPQTVTKEDEIPVPAVDEDDLHPSNATARFMPPEHN